MSGVVIRVKGALNTLVQPKNAVLDQLSLATAASDGSVFQRVGGSWVSRSLAQIRASFGVPAGGIQGFGGSAAPAGWLMCDGALVSRTTYADLFAAIGVLYGAGDGSTTFALPDLRGRAAFGYNVAVTEFNAINKFGGATTHTLAATESGVPAHTHTTGNDSPDHAHSHVEPIYYGVNSAAGGDYGVYGPGFNNTAGASARHTHAVNANTAAAAAAAHNNMPPYLTIGGAIIKT